MSVPDHSRQEPQSAGAVLMVRPASFGFNPQTAASNAFQRNPGAFGGAAQGVVQAEFDGVAEALQRAGIEVLIALDTLLPPKPDAIFARSRLAMALRAAA